MDIRNTYRKPLPEQFHAAAGEDEGVMRLASLAGELLLENGSEIYRTQETVTRIIEACGYTNHNVYVLSNAIWITINENMDNACSSLRYVSDSSLNLSRIAEVNQISRELCARRCTAREAYIRLLECKKPMHDRSAVMTVACGIGAGGFSVLFGGSPADGFCAFLIGCLLQLTLNYFRRIRLSRPATNIFASFLITMAAQICLLPGFSVSFDKIVIGAIIPLVPGYAFTTSIRDFVNADYLSGIIHLVDALCTAFFIAIGCGVGVMLIQSLGGISL